MANYVNMPDFDYGGYLAHHGIIGQKWGVRRFQNKDGTWTDVGKKRYGRGGVARRLMTGDYAFGNKRIQEKNEEYLKNRIAKRKAKGKDTSKLEEQYKIRRNANRDLDDYLSETSTKKLAAQNLLLNVGADTYRKARARGEGRGSAFASALLTDASIPVGYAVDSIKEKKRYGNNKKSNDAGYSKDQRSTKNVTDKTSAQVEKDYRKYQRLQGTKSLLGGDHSNDESVKVLKSYHDEVYANRKKLRNQEKSSYKNSIASIQSKHIDSYAKGVLKDMGYDTSPESVAWLKKQPWFYMQGAGDIVF